jgi:hypothetical protein
MSKNVYEVELMTLAHKVLLQVVATCENEALIQAHKTRIDTDGLANYLIGTVHRVVPITQEVNHE